MLIIDGKTQLVENPSIFERSYNMRGENRTAIEITFDLDNNPDLTYDILKNTFVDGCSIIRHEITTVYDEVLTNPIPEGEEPPEDYEPIYETVEREVINEYDLTEFNVAGDIIDKRDQILDDEGNVVKGGTFVVYMGKKTKAELTEEENAELILMMGGFDPEEVEESEGGAE